MHICVYIYIYIYIYKHTYIYTFAYSPSVGSEDFPATHSTMALREVPLSEIEARL